MATPRRSARLALRERDESDDVLALLLSLLAVLAGWLATRRDPAGSPLLTLSSLLLLLSLPLFMLLPKVTVEINADPSQTATLSGTALPVFGILWLT